MKKITMTLSSAEVALTAGKGSVTASVNNASSAPERVVLGAFPAGSGGVSSPSASTPGSPPSVSSPTSPPTATPTATPPSPGAGNGGVGAEGTESASTSGAMPVATVDRPLRTISPGATEQFEVDFDTTGLEPGTYSVKLIPYSADEAPEDYAVLGHTVTLAVTAPAKVAKKKGFPWWLVILAAVVLIGGAIAAVVFFRPTAAPTPVASPSVTASPSPSDVIVLELTGFSPSSGPLVGGIPVTLNGRFVEPTTVSVGPVSVEATRVSDTEYTFTLPPGSSAGQVQLVIESGGEKLGVAIFEYEAPPTPDPGPTLCERFPTLCFPVERIPNTGFERVPGLDVPDPGIIDPGDIIVPDFDITFPGIGR